MSKGMFSGDYGASSQQELTIADSVIVSEFAVNKIPGQPGIVNEALAQFVTERYANLPTFMSPTVAEAMEIADPDFVPEEVFKGKISAGTLALSGGSWQEMSQAKQMLAERGLSHPILVGQAFHVGRVALQARKLGLDTLLPPGLPKSFDPSSSQWWCRNRAFWPCRELPGRIYLYLKGQI
jgi:hypothetical protein